MDKSKANKHQFQVTASQLFVHSFKLPAHATMKATKEHVQQIELIIPGDWNDEVKSSWEEDRKR